MVINALIAKRNLLENSFFKAPTLERRKNLEFQIMDIDNLIEKLRNSGTVVKNRNMF